MSHGSASSDSGSLAGFQDAFTAALLAPLTGADVPVAMQHIVAQPGFAIHRNTVIKGCVDVLVDAFPSVTRLVGEAWMRAACAVHVTEGLPRTPVLLDYGTSFAAFLDRFEPAQQLPYLSGVARLDRAWLECHVAAEFPGIDAGERAVGHDHRRVRSRLSVHPSTRVVTCDTHPIFTIWLRNRERSPSDAPIDWHGESALLVRRDGVVRTRSLDPAAVVILEACLAGATIEQCGHAALDTDPHCVPAELVHTLLHEGALVAQRTTP